MPGTDRDLVRPLQKRIEKRYRQSHAGHPRLRLEPQADGLRATFEGPTCRRPQAFDRVLVAVGRSANGNAIEAAAAGVAVTNAASSGRRQMRTNVPHIFAIGDIAGQPMLAHKATHEAKVAAEVAAGHKSSFDAAAFRRWRTRIRKSPGSASPRRGASRGSTTARRVSVGGQRPLARDQSRRRVHQAAIRQVTRRVIGGGIVGTNAGELIAEVGLAIEMGADAADIGLTIHAHPTLSETVAFSAEAFEGTLTDLYIPKR